MPTDRKPRVYLLASSETIPSVLYGLYDVLSTAGGAFNELVTGERGEPSLDVKIVARSCTPFRCGRGVVVEPHLSIDDVCSADAIVVCNMYMSTIESPRGRHPAEVGFLKRMHEAGSIVSSVCSGSLLLADSGLLDGHQSATHWAFRSVYAQEYPRVNLRPQDTLTVSGEDGRLVTAGGVSAWNDLALYLIARLCGQRQAIEAAKVHLITAHEEGQLPYAAIPASRQRNDAVIHECQAWIATHYMTPRPVSKMVERSGLNARTFARRFLAATGYSPIDYVHTLRMEEAKQFLETEDMPIDVVSQEVGYEDPAYFRRLFRRKVGLTPARYRRKFCRFLLPSSSPHQRSIPRRRTMLTVERLM